VAVVAVLGLLMDVSGDGMQENTRGSWDVG
jgi:hypothetical protein